MRRLGLLLWLLLLLPFDEAAAQIGPEPIPWFAADVRAAIPRFKADPAIATSLTVTTEDLPTWGLGVVVGAHIYPLRMGPLTLGLGGELIRSRARRTRPAIEEGGTEGPTVETHLNAISPQVSFNFGHRDGWSYISGGLGAASLTSEVVLTGGAPAEAPGGRKAINYGGGARWFAKKHLAVSLDLRFYAVSPRTATALEPGYPRMTVMVFTGGIAFKVR